MTKTDAIVVNVPYNYRTLFRQVFGDVAAANSRFEIFDKKWLNNGPDLARTYYIQAEKFLHMKETHQTITVHGFTLDEMDSVRDEILEIESVAQIDKTNQTERRGMHNILVSNDIIQD